MPDPEYFKRFQMVRHFGGPPASPELPPGYRWLAWRPELADAHAAVKFASFAATVDAVVFPSLGTPRGCQTLMRAIVLQPGFHAPSTWLVEGPDGPCGTVQGVRERAGLGAVQNLGVVPAERGRGLGRLLLVQAMAGFRQWGLAGVTLEVTALNGPAVRLYRRAGFRCLRTVYKRVEAGPGAP